MTQLQNHIQHADSEDEPHTYIPGILPIFMRDRIGMQPVLRYNKVSSLSCSRNVSVNSTNYELAMNRRQSSGYAVKPEAFHLSFERAPAMELA